MGATASASTSASAGGNQPDGGAPLVRRPCGIHNKVAGLKAYHAGWPFSRSVILIVSDRDAFGSGDDARLMRELADKFAAVGYRVVVPDFSRMDPFVPRQDRRWSFRSWLNYCSPDNAFERAKLVCSALLEKEKSRVVAIGFSLGAKVVVDLARSNQFIKAAVILESSSVTLEDIQEVRVPIFIAALRHGDSTAEQLMGQFKDLLLRRYSTLSHVELYPDLEDAERSSEMERFCSNSQRPVKCAMVAFKDLLRWIDWIMALSLADSIRRR